MVLVNPIWMIFPVFATAVACVLILIHQRRRRTSPFTALHWLQPAARKPRGIVRSRPPILLILTAAALISGAAGTLHWRPAPVPDSNHSIHIWFSLRRLGRRRFAFMRMASRRASEAFTITGLGPPLHLSSRHLAHAILLPLGNGANPRIVKLIAHHTVLWHKRIPSHFAVPSLNVYCTTHVPSSVIRALAAIRWVHLMPRISGCRLLVGRHLRRHLRADQLIFLAPGGKIAAAGQHPVILRPGARALTDVGLEGVWVRPSAASTRYSGWRTLATVAGHPWILQRNRGQYFDWLVTSPLTSKCTDWPRYASFVIFIMNCARISAGVPPGSAFWHVYATVRMPHPPAVQFPDIRFSLLITAAILALAALLSIAHRPGNLPNPS